MPAYALSPRERVKGFAYTPPVILSSSCHHPVVIMISCLRAVYSSGEHSNAVVSPSVFILLT